MRPAALRSAVVGALLAAEAAGFAQGSPPGADAERRAQVVARIGSVRTITVGELEDRIAETPAMQRAAFGESPEAIRRRFLTEVLVPDALLSAAAEIDKLGQRPPASQAIERAVSGATIRALRAHIGPAASIPMNEVRAYYDKNRDRYDSPERYLVWRILCPTRDEALTVLDAARKDPTPDTFAALARDHSQDKATYLRSGNVGFVTPDGASNEPGLRVDPAVVRAVQHVRDGELVSDPVPEGDFFAVVWRRGTIASTRRSVDEVAPAIRDALWKARVKEETDKAVAALRAANLRDLDESLLDRLP